MHTFEVAVLAVDEAYLMPMSVDAFDGSSGLQSDDIFLLITCGEWKLHLLPSVFSLTHQLFLYALDIHLVLLLPLGPVQGLLVALLPQLFFDRSDISREAYAPEGHVSILASNVPASLGPQSHSVEAPSLCVHDYTASNSPLPADVL